MLRQRNPQMETILNLSESIQKIHQKTLKQQRYQTATRLPSPKKRLHLKGTLPPRPPRNKSKKLPPAPGASQRARLVRSPRLQQGSFYLIRNNAMLRSLKRESSS